MPLVRSFRAGAPLLVMAALLSLLAATPAGAVFLNGKLQIIHLDANQGDACVIITPGGQVAMIDEGTNFTVGTSTSSCTKVLQQLQALGVDHVNLHFASHYHADHIGCITALSGVTIDQGWDRAESYSSATYTNYVNYLGAKRHTLVKGQVWTLDSLSTHPVTIKCVALNGDGISTSDENSQCLVLKVSYGEFDEVLGGDLTGYPSGSASSNTNIETKVGPQVGKVEVYKVHHHGSAYASYDDWLNATQPKIGVISVGTGNTYGHPTSLALNRLHNHNVRTYWTQMGGGSGGGATPNPTWDKVANGQIRIYAVWQPGGVDSVLANGIADTLTNSGQAVDQVAPLVAVNSPVGGETFAMGASVPVNWSASDNVGVTSVDVEYTTDDGSNWSPIALAVPNSGSTPWNVPNLASALARVRVTAHDATGNLGSAESPGDFTIADQTLPLVTVDTPNGGETFFPGDVHTIDWSASDNVGVDSVEVDLSVHGTDGPWEPVAHGLANSGSVSWTVPDAATDSAVVRVSALDAAQNTAFDTSDSLFHIGSGLTGVGDGRYAFALFPPVPSPTVGPASLQFSLATPGDAQFDVFDLAGRRVWSTTERGLAAGPHAVSWAGHADDGRPVGTGIYFVRLRAGAHSATTKVIVLR